MEDEPSLAMILVDSMEAEGFQVWHCSSVSEGLKCYFEVNPDLLVLDVMLAKSSGFEMAKTIRNTDKLTPILFLTAKSKVKDVITGFQVGGNDYLKKPFSIEELIVRIRVLLSDTRLLNLSEPAKNHIFQIGLFSFDSNQQILYDEEEIIQLTGREAALLKLFCEHLNHLLSKQSILLKIWGDDSFFNSRSMDVFISKLRKHLKKDPTLKIINIRGAGYKLVVA